MTTSHSDRRQTFGALVRHHRVEHNMTQGEVARRAGMVQPDISLVESGSRLPTTAAALSLAAAVGVERDAALLALAAARGYHEVSFQGSPQDRELAKLAAAAPVLRSATAPPAARAGEGW